MIEQIELALDPQELELQAGDRAEVSVTVVSRRAVVDEFNLVVEGLDPTWYTVRVPSVNLFPNDRGVLSLELHLPAAERLPGGVYPARFRVVSRDDPGTSAVIELPIHVAGVARLELDMRPRVVTTRGRARFHASVRNTGTELQAIDLLVTDPEEALEVRIDEDRFAVPMGDTVEVPFGVRPKHRPWVAPPRRYTFTLAARRAEQELETPIATVDGELTYRARLGFLVGLSPRARRLLLGAAGALAALALLVWLYFGPIDDAIGRGGGDDLAASGQSGQPVAVAGGGAGVPPASTPEPRRTGDEPYIARFELRPAPGANPGEFRLEWEVQNADEVQVEGSPRALQDQLLVRIPPEGHEFVLVARNQAGVAERRFAAVFMRPPEIVQLRVEPEVVERGSSATLVWETLRADRAGLNNEVVATAGTQEVTPGADTTYRLIAENELGRAERSVQLRVVEPSQSNVS